MKKKLIVAVLPTLVVGAFAFGHADAWGNCTVRRGGTYYSAVCQGTGRFRAVASCLNADNVFVTKDYANAAYGLATPIEPHVSDDYCPFGTHPGAIQLQSV